MLRYFRISMKLRTPALIPYVTAGFPSVAATETFLRGCASAGASAVELGIPFSDPIADGVTIQAASAKALKNGMTLLRALEVARRGRGESAPLILMSYLNPILRMGLAPFLARARRAGVKGLILPDVSLEESAEIRAACDRAAVALIQLVSPASPPERIRRICRASRGFVYAVSVTGTTGARKRLPEELPEFLRRVKACSRLPVCVGFGISRPRQARALLQSRRCDGVIVGSALLSRMERGAAAGLRFLASFRKAMDSGI